MVYMAPEYCTGIVSPGVDVYSFGVVSVDMHTQLYYVLHTKFYYVILIKNVIMYFLATQRAVKGWSTSNIKYQVFIFLSSCNIYQYENCPTV